jgi:hypothetical protein
MKIVRFSIQNYKCFRDETTLDLNPGFNIITGQNNAGKTALLEALSLKFEQHPHRSSLTVRTPVMHPNPQALVGVRFEIGQDEWNEILSLPGRSFIPLPRLGGPLASQIGYARDDAKAFETFDAWLRSLDKVTVDGRMFISPNGPVFSNLPSFEGLEHRGEPGGGLTCLSRDVGPDGQVGLSTTIAPASNVWPWPLVGHLARQIYRFSAERFSGTCPVGPSTVLEKGAANLAEALSVLFQGNTRRTERFNRLVHEVLPQVHSVSTRPFQLGSDLHSRVLVWEDPNTEREDLAIPLEDSGSGVGQVLAILYVAFTSTHDRTILIDEPQSFLHPGAARKLIEILRTEFAQHQFIVTTHSPGIINAADPDAIFVLRQLEDNSARVEKVDMRQASIARGVLAEVGATPADVYGADRILWVEGRTEEDCFPRILRILRRQGLHGVVLKGVINTGDFEGKKADLVVQIYRNLSGGAHLIAPTIGFVFDDECRSDQQKKELNNRAGNLVRFLPCRMYENYLLHPDAIVGVLNDYDPEARVDEARIAGWIEQHRLDKEANRGVPADHSGDVQWIDAAWLLKKLFAELSGARLNYEKTIHSIAMTDWLLANQPERLRELADFIWASLQVQPA